MKKIILLGIFIITGFQGYSQCTDCHDGRNFHHGADASTLKKTGNGNNTLGVIFDSTMCGLNYVQAIQNNNNRSTIYQHFKTTR